MRLWVVAWLLVLPSVADAAGLLTSATCTGKATGTTCAPTALSVAVGDLAIVAFADQVGGSAPTIADTLGNSWTALSGPTTNTARLSKWFSRITTGGSMTVTITFGSSANSRAGIVATFSGSQATPNDANPANANDATSQYDCPSSGTLAQTNELVIGFGGVAGPNGDVVAAVAPDILVTDIGTTGGAAGTNTTAILTYRVVSATTAVAPAFTIDANRTGVVGTASFKVDAPSRHSRGRVL